MSSLLDSEILITEKHGFFPLVFTKLWKVIRRKEALQIKFESTSELK